MDSVASATASEQSALKDAARDRSEAAETRLEADKALATIAARHKAKMHHGRAEAQAEKRICRAGIAGNAKLRFKANTAIVREPGCGGSANDLRRRPICPSKSHGVLWRVFPASILTRRLPQEICAKICSLPAEAREQLCRGGKDRAPNRDCNGSTTLQAKRRECAPRWTALSGENLHQYSERAGHYIATSKSMAPPRLSATWGHEFEGYRQELKL